MNWELYIFFERKKQGLDGRVVALCMKNGIIYYLFQHPTFKLSAFGFLYSNDVKKTYKNLRQYRHYEKRIWPLIRLPPVFWLLKQRPNIAVWL